MPDNHNPKWEALQEQLEQENQQSQEDYSASGNENTTGFSQSNEESSLLKQKLLQKEEEINALKKEIMLKAADEANILARTKREVEKISKFAVEKFARSLLPVIDSLEKSLEHLTVSDENLRQGIQMTLDLFLNVLSKEEICPIDPLGKPFDPAQQEAVSTVPSEDHPPNTVITVLQKAYMLHDRLLRPALVVVTKKID